MSDFRRYTRLSIHEMRPYVEGEILPDTVHISSEDAYDGSPRVGDMIARDPTNHNYQWLVAAKHFTENFAPEPPQEIPWYVQVREDGDTSFNIGHQRFYLRKWGSDEEAQLIGDFIANSLRRAMQRLTGRPEAAPPDWHETVV